MDRLKNSIMIAASRAAIQPNDLIRFIVDYGNGVDPVEPCAAVMTFCEYLLASQSLSQEAVRDEALEEALNHAEVIGNVVSALLDLNVTYDGSRAIFTFEITDNAMGHIWSARDIVAKRLDAIRVLKREPNVAAQVSSRTQMPEQSGQRPAPAAPKGFRAIDDVVSEIERDPVRKGELDKAREHLREFVSPAPAAPDVESMVEQLRQWGPALKIGAAIPRAQVGDLMAHAAALLAKLGQRLACPRPQIIGAHACKDRTQCWEPCGDLGHHEEYAKPAPGASDD